MSATFNLSFSSATLKRLGPTKVEVPSPEKYLLEHSKEPKLTETAKADNRIMGIHSKKDFANHGRIEPGSVGMPLTWRCSALDRCATRELFENIMAVLRKPQPIYADTKTGDKQLLENSGLVPKYIKKNDFGKNPEYLQQHADEVRRVQDKYESYVNERMYQESRRTGVMDTTPKKYCKERLELEMKQLERDIDLIKRYKTIYIVNNN
ncbi:enkurin [Salvelinus namaycush]|uniref:Enkurin n=1 Tax=Salvelinus namaycush TaxID=8040 RepID=A0A8U0R139_SALNM|nr:enkurin [Salvelinus namaycush]